jgi:hypothetical protein
MLKLNLKEQYRATGYDWSPEGIGLYAQVRPSSGLRYPRLEMDRWYPIRRQDDLGCFIEIGNAEMYLERGHYVCREGRRGSDRPNKVAVNDQPVASRKTRMAVGQLARSG